LLLHGRASYLEAEAPGGSMSEIVTLAQAAERFKVSTSLLYQLVEAGKIDHFRIGTAIRFDLDKLIEHFSRSRVGGVGPKERRKKNGQPT
jgi:excisionase family DNA binding protein